MSPLIPVVPDALVRRARPDELQAVGDLTVAVYLRDGLANPEYLPTLGDAAGRAAAATLLVAVDSRTDALMGSVTLVAHGGPYGELAGPDEAEIRMLVVDPSARGRGVGELLTRACIEAARAAGRRRMVLSTRTSMAAAHRLYERLGFARTPDADWSPLPGVDLIAYGRDL